jgi:pimeloyl-ACP methyl ester carboxylesterase
MANAALAAALAADFSVFNFDRRGRGDSGDTPPYAVEREIEDIAAVIGAAGGRAALYGTSSGAGLALHAAARLGATAVARLAMWEPPYFVDPAKRPPLDQPATYNRLIAEGRRDAAVEYFMHNVVGLPNEFVAFARTQPFWAGQEKIAHTLAYDAIVMGDYMVPTALAATAHTPTLVICGGASFDFMCESARALAEALPSGEFTALEGQQHNVDPAALAPALTEFFKA